jgi:hypothetical protein
MRKKREKEKAGRKEIEGTGEKTRMREIRSRQTERRKKKRSRRKEERAVPIRLVTAKGTDGSERRKSKRR